MRKLSSTLIFLVCSFVMSTDQTVFAGCPAGYRSATMNGPCINGCSWTAFVCLKYFPPGIGTPAYVDVIITDLIFVGDCNCPDRATFISNNYDVLLGNCLSYLMAQGDMTSSDVPSCPSQLLIGRISPTACATECIATGDYATFCDGSYGAVYKSWTCSDLIWCYHNYAICCPALGCPPYSFTDMGWLLIGPQAQCTTKTVYCTSCPFGCTLYCYAQCQ